MRLAWALSLLLWLAACGTAVDIPEGVFACVTRADCPEAFECQADGFCYQETDAGAPSDASPDAME